MVDRQSFLSFFLFSKLRWHKWWEEEVFEKVWEGGEMGGEKGIWGLFIFEFRGFSQGIV